MPTTYISVPFPEAFVPLAMTLSEQLRQGKPGLSSAVQTLLDSPAQAGQAAAPTAAPSIPYVTEARLLLRNSEPGRKAVLLAMAATPGVEVARADLIKVFGVADGRPNPHHYHIVGVLSGVTRGAKKSGFPHAAYDSRWDGGRRDYFCRLNPLLAEAINAAAAQPN